MKLTFRRGLAGAATAALTVGVAVTAAPAFAADSDEFVMYITNWGPVDTIKQLHETGVANHVTTINYAFGDVRPANLTRAEAYDGGFEWTDYDEAVHGPIVCTPAEPERDFFRTYSADEGVSGYEDPGGQIEQVRLLKEMHPQIKVVPSIGGWTLSKWFSVASLTEESRQTLVDSCIDLWIDGNYTDDEFGAAANFAGVFDGIDIDWEYPAALDGGNRGEWYNSVDLDDGVNYTALTKQFREALGNDALLTAATPASGWTGGGYDWSGMAEYLDWFQLMAYDLHGTWETQTGHGAAIDDPAWGVAASVNYYLNDNGLDPSQVVLGIPFYGPGWKNVDFDPAVDDNPVGLPGDGLPEEESLRYFEIIALAQALGLDVEWDDDARASYIYDPASQTFYSFDAPRDIVQKINELVLELGLRGEMVWEFNGDTADAELSHTIIEALNLPYVETVPLPDRPEPEVPDTGGDEDPAPPAKKQPGFTG